MMVILLRLYKEYSVYGLPRWLSGKDLPASAEDTLEEEMATHPSILAWRIPWT